MNKKILLSFLTIGVVLASVGGATRAFFSDTETSEGNTFSAGTIDISVDDQNPWSDSFNVEDMKPSETGYINFEIHNPGSNPVNVWKHIKNVETGEGTMTEPECEAYGGTWVDHGDHCSGGTESHDIDGWILYDLSVEIPSDSMGDPAGEGWHQVIYDENVTVADITSEDVFLGMIPAGKTMEVTQSYHLNPETGNEYQGDEMTFDIEIYAEQLTGELVLNTKSESDDWLIQRDGTWGKLTYNLTGPTFDYEFEGYNLQAGTEYCLIYYADPWPGTGGREIACGSTSSTDLSLSGSVDLGMDIPVSGDNNYPEGGKIWLVLADDYDTNDDKMVGWNPDSYLFETGLIQYDDTDL